MKMNRYGVLTSFVVAVTLTGIAKGSVLLPIGGGPVVLPGSTAAAEPDLAGTVMRDNLIPFRVSNAAGSLLFVGELQNRVVRSSRGSVLHFYYSIRNTQAGLNGIISNVYTRSFAPTPTVAVDWRPDGLGQVNPLRATRSIGTGDLIRFNFPSTISALSGGRESKFFFIKTNVLNYALNGQTRIQLTSGESIVLNTAAPIP